MNRCWMFPQTIAVLTGYLDEYAPLAKYTVEVNKREYCDNHDYHLEVIREVRPKYQDGESHGHGFTWSRLEHLLDMVKSGYWEWIWTVGADTLITNMGIALEDIIATATTPEAEKLPLPMFREVTNSKMPPRVTHWKAPANHPRFGRKHLLICGECVAPVQSDSFIMRSSTESADYLRDILEQWPAYKHHVWVENQTMIDLREKHAAITCILPQWMLNSYDYRRFYANHPVYRSGLDCYGNRGQWKPGDFLIHWAGATMAQRQEYLEFYKTQIQ